MLFAIGDIHGHFDKLMRLMSHCRAFAEARGEARARFVLLGDYVDRGPASRQVLEFLDSRPADVMAILGNHEAMMAAAVQGGSSFMLWLANGGSETLASYGIGDPRRIPPDHLQLIGRLPLFVDDGLRLFVHAGIDPGDPDGRDPETLLWTRKHPGDDQPLPRFIVHGHTPVHQALPELHRNRLNLDTGAGYGRDLSAAAFSDESAPPLALLNDAGGAVDVPPPAAA